MSDSDNPYLPPKAVVADVSEEVQLVRPMAVNLALLLIGVRLLLGLGVMVRPMLATNTPLPMSMYVMATMFVAVTLALGYFIARGRNWARILYLVTTIFGLAGFLFVAFNLPPGVSLVNDPTLLWLLTVLVPQLLSIAVVVLLFGPGRAWFRARA
jgi:hypothetical protein